MTARHSFADVKAKLEKMLGAERVQQADGLLTRAHADALLAGLEAANIAGHYCTAGLTHVVGGRVPS